MISDEKFTIAILRLGGFGDMMVASGVSFGINRLFPNSTQTIVSNLSYSIFKNHPFINYVINTSNDWEKSLLSLFGKFDILFDVRYVSKVYFKEGVIKKLSGNTKFVRWKRELDIFQSKYGFHYANFLRCNNETGKLGFQNYELITKSLCLQSTPDDMFIDVDDGGFNGELELYNKNNIITLHNGAGIGGDGRLIKCLPTVKWNVIAKWLRSNGFTPVQVGTSVEEKIDYCVNLSGKKLTLHQTAGILKKSKLHLDTEGGLVYIAKAVGTKSLVLFGPTPLEFFGFLDNINIGSKLNCVGCWWSSSDWFRKCPKDYVGGCKAMNEFDITEIFKALEKELVTNVPINIRVDVDLNTKKEIIYIVRQGGIGDLIMLEPSLSEMRKKGKVGLCINKEWIEFAKEFNLADEVLPLENKHKLAMLNLINLTQRLESSIYRFTIPRVDIIANELKVVLSRKKPIIKPDFNLVRKWVNWKERNIKNKFKCIGITLKSSSVKKDWSKENFSILISLLLNDGYNIILIDLEKDLILDKHPNLFDIRGEISIVDVVGVLSLLDLFITVDTGNLHIAGALGVKTISIFGPTSPYIFTAYYDNFISVSVDLPCWPCHETDCNNQKCLNMLEPEDIFDIVKEEI